MPATLSIVLYPLSSTNSRMTGCNCSLAGKLQERSMDGNSVARLDAFAIVWQICSGNTACVVFQRTQVEVDRDNALQQKGACMNYRDYRQMCVACRGETDLAKRVRQRELSHVFSLTLHVQERRARRAWPWFMRASRFKFDPWHCTVGYTAARRPLARRRRRRVDKHVVSRNFAKLVAELRQAWLLEQPRPLITVLFVLLLLTHNVLLLLTHDARKMKVKFDLSLLAQLCTKYLNLCVDQILIFICPALFVITHNNMRSCLLSSWQDARRKKVLLT